MTQEDKQLLLRDLSARLPYGIKVDHFGVIKELLRVIPSSENVMVGYDINNYEDSVIEDIKPYLRPMSSITEEESLEYQKRLKIIQDIERTLHWCNTVESIDWLNAHHFDYRGLIKKGLALEAPEGMYKFE